MRLERLTIIAVLLFAGCTARARPAAVSPADLLGDARLHEILAEVPLDSAAQVALQQYELEHLDGFLEQVALVAEDSLAGASARYHALTLLGERRAGHYLHALQAAAGDRDPRVRAAAVVAAGRILEKSGTTGRSVLVAALDDPAPQVQAKALELLGTRDLALLRSLMERNPSGEIAGIARGLLHSAEDRGAPLPPDSVGVLRRWTAGGAELVFEPARRWPQWDAAVGTVRLQVVGSPPVRIEDVEVVGGVVPVFFAPDESAIVYEQYRRIYVRELATGVVREVGPGIAPRPLPFTEDFVYFREDPGRGGEFQERYRLSYDVVRAGFGGGGGAPVVLGAFSEMRLHGNYSPARWLRVVERDGQFTLEGEGAETYRLPALFGAGDGP